MTTQPEHWYQKKLNEIHPDPMIRMYLFERWWLEGLSYKLRFMWE